MLAVCASEEQTITSPVSQVFGRARHFLFIDTDTLQVEVIENPALNEGGGAGIKAAQFVVDRGAQAVVAGNFGPNAFQVLNAAELPCYSVDEISIETALESIRNNTLVPINTPSAKAHAGMKGGEPAENPIHQKMADAKSENEHAVLKKELAELRQKLSKTLSRIEELEKEN